MDKLIRSATLQETGRLYDIQYRGAPSVPALTLKGQWLDKAGFPAGMTATIKIDTGRLVVEAPGAAGVTHADRLDTIRQARAQLVEQMHATAARSTAASREQLLLQFAWSVAEALGEEPS